MLRHDQTQTSLRQIRPDQERREIDQPVSGERRRTQNVPVVRTHARIDRRADDLAAALHLPLRERRGVAIDETTMLQKISRRGGRSVLFQLFG